MLEVRIVAQVPSQEHSIPRTLPEQKKIEKQKKENINFRDFTMQKRPDTVSELMATNTTTVDGR